MPRAQHETMLGIDADRVPTVRHSGSDRRRNACAVRVIVNVLDPGAPGVTGEKEQVPVAVQVCTNSENVTPAASRYSTPIQGDANGSAGNGIRRFAEGLPAKSIGQRE